MNARDLTVHEDHASKVKHFIMTNEKQHIICFNKTSFDSKYLPIDESNITIKTNLKMFSNKFPASGVVFAVVPVLQGKNISVNIKCDLLS